MKRLQTKYFIAILLFILTTDSFALFCPTNFSQVNIGDTIAQVIETCGEPISQNTYKKTSILSEEWHYYVKTQFNDKATTKMTVVFKDNRVINIHIADNSNLLGSALYAAALEAHRPQPIDLAYNAVNQQTHNVENTRVCGSPIKIGDSMPLVENACGKPIAIQQNQSPDIQDSAIEVTALQYGGATPATLLFENGIFKERA